MREDDFWWKTTFDRRQLMMEDDLWWKTTYDRRWLMMEDDMPMPELYTALPYTAVAVIFFSRSKDVLKKRINTAREVWSTSPLWSSPLLQSMAQQEITSPIVARPKLSKRGQSFFCSECPYATEKWMTGFDHMKKKHQFRGTLEDILDKETCNLWGQTSLRVAQGKFYDSLHGKLG